ncbi:MAG: putative lipid II flippase FtsW [Neisseriaceae bacterium]|nr:MAG: putative lipid II flippase FtsW [Neisseriaceae bacterium]
MNRHNKLLDRKILNERYDKILMWVLILLIVFGLVMIYSASVDGRIRKIDSEYYYIIRQGIFFFISIIFGLVNFATISMRKLQRLIPLIVFVSLFLLIFVLFVGTEVNGAKRWIRILGIFNIQPAELFKFVVILYLASYLHRKFEVLTEFKKIWFVGIVPAFGAALILVSGDLGSAVIVFVITLSMLFMAGLRLSWFLIIIVIGLIGAVFAILIAPYRIERIMTFLHPEADPLGAGFQTIQSFVANANGGIWGVGLGNGMARYGLPELHTDFIASFIVEELGVVALIILCFTYIWITIRAFSIGKKASDLDLFYSSFVAKGIGVWIGIQALLHIGINTGTLPTKGLTLPFVSYGGSSLLVGVLAISVLMRIDYENRRKTLGFDI